MIQVPLRSQLSLIDRSRNRENLFLLDPKTGTKLAGIAAHPMAVRAVAISPDGKTVATVSFWEKIARLWDVSQVYESVKGAK